MLAVITVIVVAFSWSAGVTPCTVHVAHRCNKQYAFQHCSRLYSKMQLICVLSLATSRLSVKLSLVHSFMSSTQDLVPPFLVHFKEPHGGCNWKREYEASTTYDILHYSNRRITHTCVYTPLPNVLVCYQVSILLCGWTRRRA